jgi:O-acetylserine/cysteine efflux transporter
VRPAHLLLGVLVTLIWGGNFSVIEVGLQDLDPFLLTALRFTFTALPMVFLVKRPRGVPLWAMATYGLLFGVGLWWVVNLAMARGMSPGLSSLVLQFAAFFTVILSALVFRERIRLPQWVGMVLAVAGLCWVIHATSGTSTLAGIALVLLAAVSWSACNLVVKRTRPADMLAFVVWTSLFPAPALFLLTWLDRGAAPFMALPHAITWAAVGSVLFQAWVTTIFGYAVWNFLMKTYPASSVAPLSLLVPVSGIVTSAVAFGEHFTAPVWAGVAIMLCGVAVFLLAPRLVRQA